jgi:hypothetical protein
MHYHGPDQADLANVFVLNSAFIAWQRSRPPETLRQRDLAPEIRARLNSLSFEERGRLARTPFLLVSLVEDDEARWRTIFAERLSRDLFESAPVRDEAAARLAAAALGFLWQLAQRNPYAARLVSGAGLNWCEQLSACTLMELYSRALEAPVPVAPRMADKPDLWNRLLTAGVSNRRHLRLAARVAALQTLLTQGPARPDRPLAAAACRMPTVRTRTSGRHGK